jgi:hypothetical protein
MAKTIDVMAPVVHPNGTSKEELLNLREEAYSALDAAADALRQMAPNARDYQGWEDFERARTQHAARVKALRDVQKGIEDECTAINGY